jgi:hypothetical protein
LCTQGGMSFKEDESRLVSIIEPDTIMQTLMIAGGNVGIQRCKFTLPLYPWLQPDGSRPDTLRKAWQVSRTKPSVPQQGRTTRGFYGHPKQ